LTTIRVGYVDVHAVRPGARPGAWQMLALRRAPDRDRPGSWEIVHGHIDAAERPDECARRELREETGLAPHKFYNLSRVDAFYENRTGEVIMIPVFVAFVDAAAAVTLSAEHDGCEWLAPEEAQRRLTWPRERRAIDDILLLLGTGGGGAVEDVLRVV
jgi:dATP pyrophosphohydrolase